MVAIVHLKNARLTGPANCIEYLDAIKLPDQITHAMMASIVPIWTCLLYVLFKIHFSVSQYPFHIYFVLMMGKFSRIVSFNTLNRWIKIAEFQIGKFFSY